MRATSWIPMLWLGTLLAPVVAFPCEPMAPVSRLLPKGAIDADGDWLVFDAASLDLRIAPADTDDWVPLAATCSRSVLGPETCAVRTPPLEPGKSYQWLDANTGMRGDLMVDPDKPAPADDALSKTTPTECRWHPESETSCGRFEAHHGMIWDVERAGSGREAVVVLRGEEDPDEPAVMVTFPEGVRSVQVKVRGTSRCVETQWLHADGSWGEVLVQCGDAPACPMPMWGPWGCSSVGQGPSLAFALALGTLLWSVRRRRRPVPAKRPRP